MMRMSIPAKALPERAVLQDIIVLLMVPVVNVRLVKKTQIPVPGLPERAVLQDTIVLLMVPVVNAQLAKKTQIPAPGLPARRQKAVLMVAPATQPPQAAAHPCVSLANLNHLPVQQEHVLREIVVIMRILKII